MQSKWIFLSLAVVLVTSCRSPQKSTTESADRAPQASARPDDESARFENIFNAVMNQEGATEDEKNENRATEVTRYLRRQMDHFYLAQALLIDFDNKLDRIYRKKIKNPNADLSVDLQDFERERVGLHVAWEFTERNLHDIQSIYGRMLEEANSPTSVYQKAAALSLIKIDAFFDNLWKKDRWAVFSIADDLEEVNQAFAAKSAGANLPQFRRYLNLTKEEQHSAFFRSMRNFLKNRNTLVDKRFQQGWEKYKAERFQDHMEATKDRTPQSDTLYPDPGGNGNITGNRFGPGVWAITLDDGPHPTYTQGMLNAISGGGLKATFFWLSQNIQTYPTLVKHSAVDYGFRRGSHSFTHANLPKLGENGLHHEIDEAADVFTNVVGERPTFFRCPYGACGGNGSRIRQMIANRKMMHVFWNVDSLDWQDKNPNSIFERVRKQMEVNGHGIVLFHDIHPQSVEAMKQVVAYINNHPNLKAYTMDEIMKLETGNDYHSP